MIAVVQRVTEARVSVGDKTVGEIGRGMLVLAAVEKEDAPADVEWVANKLLTLRIFQNGEKNFDLDVIQTGGSILLVSNFTVAGETRKGRRPGLEGAAPPEKGRELFDHFVEAVKRSGVTVATGEFGADMKVSLTNDGPVTFLVQTPPRG
jgi:D-tyrosyl-tRNA(Tyr) deacylase